MNLLYYYAIVDPRKCDNLLRKFFRKFIRMSSAPMAKMDQLDKVEKEIVSCLLTAGQALAEISKVSRISVKKIKSRILMFNFVDLLFQ